jgi:hypothetical protein
MIPSIELQSAVFPTLKLIVDGAEYTVCYPLRSVIEAEEKVGHSLKSLKDWLDLPSKELPAIIAAGLSKFHPDISESQIQAILETLTAEAFDELHYALCKLSFPRVMAKLEEERTKGDVSPNAPSGDAL